MLRRYSRTSKPLQVDDVHTGQDALQFLQSALDNGKDLDALLAEIVTLLKAASKGQGKQDVSVWDQFVDAVLETTTQGTLRAIPLTISLTERSDEAWRVLEKVAEQGSWQTKRKIFTESEFLRAANAALRKGGDSAQLCLKCLNALASQGANKTALSRDPELGAAFVGVLTSIANPSPVKNECLKLIAGAAFSATSNEPQLALFGVPGLVDAISALVEGQTAANAMRALHNMSFPPRCAVQLSSNTELIDNLVNMQLVRNTRGTVILLHLLSNQGETHAALLAAGIVNKLSNMKVPADDGGYVEMRRAMILANLVGGNKNAWSQLNIVNGSTLGKILDLLKDVLKADGDAWPLAVPLRALYSLTLVDENRTSVLKDAAPVFFQALKRAIETNDWEAAALAASALSNYTYTRAECDSLMSIPDLISFCEAQTQAEKTPQSQRGIDEISGLVWGLTKRHAIPGPTTTTSSQPQGKRPLIMISYNWGNQPLAKAVAATLRKLDLDVWLDLDNMNGDVMSAMADAILQSSAVFVLVSAAYIQSCNCRREATFAAERKRKIIPLICEPSVDLDCWLGILLSGLLRYTLASTDRVAIDVPDICKKELSTIIDGRGNAASSSTAQAGAMTGSTQRWPPDISRWLKDNACEALEGPLRERDALDFDTLQKLWRRKLSVLDTMTLFSVKSVKQVLNFMEAMDRLFT